MKVAQYEVLGNNAKRDVRPGRDDRSVWAPRPLVCGFTSVSSHRSSHPHPGRVVSFERHPSTLYWATFFESLPPLPSGLWRTSRDESSGRISFLLCLTRMDDRRSASLAIP
jgi:hypothetical protein